MADLTALHCVSSGLHPAYDAVTALALDAQPLGGGGFGQNYLCQTLNQAPPPEPLVVKVLQDNGQGSAKHGSKTLHRLVTRLKALDARRQQAGELPLGSLPALAGLPQFCFEGKLHGKAVCGYAARRLDTAGYVPFDTFTEGDLRQAMAWLDLPLPLRWQMGADLAETLALLDSIGYVHGDINPPNLFVNPTAGRLALIDFDSGCVVEKPGDRPDTWGKPGDWIAPEVAAQLAAGATPIHSDRRTDLWSLGIGLHYLLFLHHPLLYLRDFGGQTLHAYFAQNLWPQIAPHDPLFHAGNAPVYVPYRQQLAALPPSLRNAFDVLLNRGTLAPDQRPDAAAWLRALQLAQTPPEIVLFLPDRLRVAAGGAVTLTWQVNHAETVWLDGVGDVTGQTACQVVVPHDQRFTLTVRNLTGQVKAHTPLIQVIRAPIPPHLRPLPLPPSLATRLSAPGTRFAAPSLTGRFVPPACVASHPLKSGGVPQGRALRVPAALNHPPLAPTQSQRPAPLRWAAIFRHLAPFVSHWAGRRPLSGVGSVAGRPPASLPGPRGLRLVWERLRSPL